jgi:CPA1 family monovalent cation:H+ antiporter
VIFLAFCVILATLVGQGLTMPFVIRALGVEDDGLDADEELSARIETAYAAIERLEHVGDDDWVNPDTLDRVRGIYDYRRRRFSSRIDGGSVDGDGTDYESRTAAYRRLMREVIDAQRGRLRELRDRGEITDEVRRRVEYDLDLEEARLES